MLSFLTPELIKALQKIILVLVVFAAIYWKRKEIGFLFTGSNTDIIDEISDETNASLITLSSAELYLLAEKLNSSLTWFNDSENDIYQVFNTLGNIHDLNALVIVCGVVDGNTILQRLRASLSAKESQNINAILAQKNINYQI